MHFIEILLNFVTNQYEKFGSKLFRKNQCNHNSLYRSKFDRQNQIGNILSRYANSLNKLILNSNLNFKSLPGLSKVFGETKSQSWQALEICI